MRASLRRKSIALGAIALLSLLTACSTPESPPEPRSTPTAAAPVFATDEEALAAATEAYAAYTETVNLIFSERGANPERIRAVASERLTQTVVNEFQESATRGIYATGQATFDNVAIQKIDQNTPDGLEIITVYLCSDVSDTDLFDSTGTSIVDPSRPGRTAFEVSFDFENTNSSLIVGSRKIWEGGGVC